MFLAYFLLSGLAALMLLHAAWLLSYARQHRQFHQQQLAQRIDASWLPQVTLFLPCKGAELGLSENLRAVLHQDYARYEICFIVESQLDPALSVIEEERSACPQVPSRVAIAGLSHDSGQKVHNLMCATAAVSPDTEVLAFADSDARPHPDWLSRMVDSLGKTPGGVVTGYRWFSPRDPTAANLLLTCLNGLVIGLMGPTRYNLIWGGAWAVRRADFEAFGFPSAWSGALCDDLAVSRVVRAAGRSVTFVPHCLTISEIDTTWAGLIEFARRQYLLVRVYTPAWWRGSCVTGLMIHGSLWTMVVTALVWMRTGGRWQFPAVVAAIYAGALMLRNWFLMTAILPFVGPRTPRSLSGSYGKASAVLRGEYHVGRNLGLVRLLLTFLGPLIMLVNWILACSVVASRTMVWRGIGYRLDSPVRMKILYRRDPQSSLTGPRQAANPQRSSVRPNPDGNPGNRDKDSRR